MSNGRFAPSPSGDLHVGNLRTALLAWLFARTTGRGFVVRVDDLDRVRPGAAARQLADLAALGLDWDGPVRYQSSGLERYAATIDELTARGLTYECYCTRKEIQQAAAAPHAPQGAYPGTCRDLAEPPHTDRPPALRLRSAITEFTVDDDLHGRFTGVVDDFVLRRGDGVPAYNLTVVVDDGADDVDQVVRGDDLLASTPRQAYLATLLGIPVPAYAHVPLALNADGKRLAKRDGAVTLADKITLGETPADVLGQLAASLGLATPGAAVTPMELAARFVPNRLPRNPWIVAGVTK